MTKEDFSNVANSALQQVRNILWHAERVNSELPYIVITALLAESSMLMQEPDAWLAELMACVSECKDAKLASLMFEANTSTHH